MKKTLMATGFFLKENFWKILAISVFGVWFFDFNVPDLYFVNDSISMQKNSRVQSLMKTDMALESFGRGGEMISTAFANDFDPEATERKIIKNASLIIEVDNTDDSKKMVEVEISKVGGSITNLNSWETRPGILAYNLTIRIPSEKLETAILNLSKIGTKKGENFSTTDITSQYFDTENRLKNLRIRRDRIRELMEKKSDNLKDVLEIDRELASVQNEIENLERTQKQRDTNVSFSTLQLTINPEPQIGDFQNSEWSVGKSWKVAVNDLLKTSRNIVDKVIQIFVYSPIWIPILLIFFFVRRRFCKKCKK
jgi:hypothetical protein